MNKVKLNSEIQTITLARALLAIAEHSNASPSSPNTHSVFSLLSQFYLTHEEKKAHLENQNFLGRLHFYLIGQTQMIEQKIESKIKQNKDLKDLILDKMTPLDPPANIQEALSDLYVAQKNILNTLKSVNRIAHGTSLTLSAFCVAWLAYNAHHFWSDYSQYCKHDSSIPEIREFCDGFCPTENITKYFYDLNTQFFALPALVLAAAVFQFFDSEILSKITSPLEHIKTPTLLVSKKISEIKDFLLDKALKINS